MKSRITILLLSFACALFGQESGAMQADITSFAQGDAKVNIAILPFEGRGEGQFGKDSPWLVIAKDFDFSSRIKPFKKKSFDSTDFALVNIPLFIKGDYTMAGKEVRIAFQLVDVATNTMIFGKEYTVDVKGMRMVAHNFANEVYMQLFGERGGFDTELLFVRRSEDGKNVYLSDYDGGNARRVTKTGLNIQPAFESDTTFLFVSYLRGKPDIYRGHFFNGSQNILLYSRRVDVSPDVNVTNGSIVYSSSRNGNMDIYSAKADGTQRTQLTVSMGIDAAPAWSPSGYYIAYISDKSGTPQIYVMDKYGGMQRRLTFEGRYHDSPVWAPDGKSIAYTTIHDGHYRIGVVDFDDNEEPQERIVTEKVPGSHRFPAWSPTGKHIAFTRSGGGYSDIFTINLDDGRARRVTNFGDAETVVWSPFFDNK